MACVFLDWPPPCPQPLLPFRVAVGEELPPLSNFYRSGSVASAALDYRHGLDSVKTYTD